MKIFVQYLTIKKVIDVAKDETVEDVKNRVVALFGIAFADQILYYNNRNINTNHKTVCDLGLNEGETILIKKQNKVVGKKSGGGMNDLMKNPFMKSMLKNPNTIKTIKEMFGNNQDGESNETMNMILNNDGLEEELEKMTEDGEYLDNQMRNVDLAMAKLENMPGGMNMMSSMLKDIENPLKKMMGETKYQAGEAINTQEKSGLPGKIKGNPLIIYRRQNAEMIAKGFSNSKDNIEALEKAQGEVFAAIEYLLEKYDTDE